MEVDSSSQMQNDEELFDGLDVAVITKTAVLAEKFSLTKFKDYQKQAIDAALKKQDVLVIQPTGKGKSLCFQFPPVYEQKKALVITPTISLMRDQTEQLNAYGLKVVYLGASKRYTQPSQNAVSPSSDINLIFATPEWLFNPCNLEMIKKLYNLQKLSLIAIDEAHLMYEWHTFQPDYSRCEELPAMLPDVPLMALSATVTPVVKEKIIKFLRSPHIAEGSIDRPNIFLSVKSCNFKKPLGSQS